MKKLILTAAIGLFSVGAMADTVEDRNGFYAGGKFGTASTDFEYDDEWGDQIDTTIDSNIWGLQLGYTLNEYIGAEVGYTSGINQSIRVEDTGLEERTSTKIEGRLFSLSLIPTFPVSDNVTFHAKLGYSDAKFKTKVKYTGYDDISGSESENGLLWGLGATYHIDQTFVRAEFERSTFAENMDSFTLGFGVRF